MADSPSTGGRPVAKRRKYTRRQKAAAVIAAEMSTVASASAQMGIPERTVGYWFDSPAFAELRAKTREDLAAESMALAHKALQVIDSKLDSFEPRDLSVLYGILTDKGQLLSGAATSRTEHRELLADFDDHERDAVADWLRELARQRLEAVDAE